jgi:catechol 2,3-dioxygenase-like lactoylglutathione lyase family enzyme
MGRVAALAVGTHLVSRVRAQGPSRWAPFIDHVQINSDDVRQSAAFYRQVLGLQLLRTGPPNDPACCPDESAFFGVGNRLILAIRKRAGRNLDHYSLMLNGLDQRGFESELAARGGSLATHDLAGVYVRDPDGVFVQIMTQPGPGSQKPPAEAAPAPAGRMQFEWEPLVDHVQVSSDDVRKATAYYRDVLGLNLLRVGPPNNRDCCPDESAFFGVGTRLVLAIRKQSPARTLDHYALLMKNFNRDAVVKELSARGATAKQSPETGFYVEDPDGIKVQLMGAPGPA